MISSALFSAAWYLHEVHPRRAEFKQCQFARLNHYIGAALKIKTGAPQRSIRLIGQIPAQWAGLAKLASQI